MNAEEKCHVRKFCQTYSNIFYSEGQYITFTKQVHIHNIIFELKMKSPIILKVIDIPIFTKQKLKIKFIKWTEI